MDTSLAINITKLECLFFDKFMTLLLMNLTLIDIVYGR